MTRTDSQLQLPVGARLAVGVLCWLATTGSPPAAQPLGSKAGVASFRLTVAECFDGQVGEAGFDLGFDGKVDSGRATAAGIPTPAQEVFRMVPPAWTHDRTALPASTETTALAPDSGSIKSKRIPGKSFGWKQFRYDLRYVVHKPAHLDASEKRTVLVIGGTTGLLYVFRKDIQEAWQESKSERRSEFLNNARFMGSGGFAPLVALTAYVASYATHNDRERETAQLVLESMALSGLGAGIGQFVLATERPEDGDAIRFFRPHGHGVSLDVALAASVIPPLRRQYLRVRPGNSLGRKILKHTLSALLYSGMVFTALQRIDADKHWAPDVFLGMVTGLGVGRTLGQAHDQATSERRSRFGINALPGGVAVTWTLSLDP